MKRFLLQLIVVISSLGFVWYYNRPSYREETREESAIWSCGAGYAFAHSHADSMRVSLHTSDSPPYDLTCGTLLRAFPDRVRDAATAWKSQATKNLRRGSGAVR